MVRRIGCFVFLLTFLLAGAAHSATILSENFDDITTLLTDGWSMMNNSSSAGSTGWFQGNPGVFSAQSGASDSYVAANFNNAGFGGDISNWLVSPKLALSNGDVISFYTRTEAAAPCPDRLEVRLNLDESSLNTGGLSDTVGDFTTLLLSINPTLAAGGYPEDWTQFSVTLTGLSGPEVGHLAFRYFVTDTSTNGDYIGIDNVSVTTGTTGVPEPATIILLGTALAAFGGLRRRFRAGR